MIRGGYCSITVDNYGGIWLIRFVSKSYIYLLKYFANKLRLVLHAYIYFFWKKFEGENQAWPKIVGARCHSSVPDRCAPSEYWRPLPGPSSSHRGPPAGRGRTDPVNDEDRHVIGGRCPTWRVPPLPPPLLSFSPHPPSRQPIQLLWCHEAKSQR